MTSEAAAAAAISADMIAGRVFVFGWETDAIMWWWWTCGLFHPALEYGIDTVRFEVHGCGL